jgi:hypothetical protein
MPQYRNPILVVVFSIITCGIYYLYWSWVTNEEIKRLSGNTEEVSTPMLIVGWFCGFVLWYNWYKWDKSLQYVSNVRAQQNPTAAPYNSNFILWIICTIIAGVGILISSFQIQDYINDVNGLSA